MNITIEVTGPVTVNYGLSDEDRLFIRTSLTTLLQGQAAMNQALTDLQAEVAANTNATQSAVALLQGLKTALDDAIAANDMDAVVAIRDSLHANTQALADAVVANTPAAPTP